MTKQSKHLSLIEKLTEVKGYLLGIETVYGIIHEKHHDSGGTYHKVCEIRNTAALAMQLAVDLYHEYGNNPIATEG